MMTIYFVRHCETDNSHRDDAGRPLTLRGKRDAERLIDFFEQQTIDVIYSSPYLRCIDTIQPLATERGLSVQTDDRLRERELGRWLDDFDAFAGRQWGEEDFKIEGGESITEVKKRMRDFFRDRLIFGASPKTYLICSHGTALCALFHDLGWTTKEFFFAVQHQTPFICCVKAEDAVPIVDWKVTFPEINQ